MKADRQLNAGKQTAQCRQAGRQKSPRKGPCHRQAHDAGAADEDIAIKAAPGGGGGGFGGEWPRLLQLLEEAAACWGSCC